MTDFQNIELAVCFGAVIGYFIGQIITLISIVIEDRRDKKKQEEAAR